MIHEFAEPIPVRTKLGEGLALFLEATRHDYYWTVVLIDSGAFLTLRQSEILAVPNFSLGILADEKRVAAAIVKAVRGRKPLVK